MAGKGKKNVLLTNTVHICSSKENCLGNTASNVKRHLGVQGITEGNQRHFSKHFVMSKSSFEIFLLGYVHPITRGFGCSEDHSVSFKIQYLY